MASRTTCPFSLMVSRGIEQAIQVLEEFEKTNKLCLSVITQLELMVGCNNKKEVQELETFLERFVVLHFTTAMSTKAVELFDTYRHSHDVKIADMLIASTVLTYDVKLLSKNQKDFRFIDELKLVKYAPE